MKKVFKSWEFWTFVIGGLALIIAYCAWQFPKQYEPGIDLEKVPIINVQNTLLNGSVFDISKKIANEEIALAAEEMLKKYNGLHASGDGYIFNISQGINNDVYYVFLQESEELSTHASDNIGCAFDKDWKQVLSTLSKGDKITFEGIIDIHSNFLNLKDCKLKQY